MSNYEHDFSLQSNTTSVFSYVRSRHKAFDERITRTEFLNKLGLVLRTLSPPALFIAVLARVAPDAQPLHPLVQRTRQPALVPPEANPLIELRGASTAACVNASISLSPTNTLSVLVLLKARFSSKHGGAGLAHSFLVQLA